MQPIVETEVAGHSGRRAGLRRAEKQGRFAPASGLRRGLHGADDELGRLGVYERALHGAVLSRAHDRALVLLWEAGRELDLELAPLERACSRIALEPGREARALGRGFRASRNEST